MNDVKSRKAAALRLRAQEAQRRQMRMQEAEAEVAQVDYDDYA